MESNEKDRTSKVTSCILQKPNNYDYFQRITFIRISSFFSFFFFFYQNLEFFFLENFYTLIITIIIELFLYY